MMASWIPARLHKQTALLLAGVAGVVALGVLAVVIDRTQGARPGRVMMAANAPQLAALAPEQVAAWRSLVAEASRPLPALPPARSAAAALSLPQGPQGGDRLLAMPAPQRKAGGPAPLPDRTLQLIASAGGTAQTAILDGVLVRPGQNVANGGVIESIGERQVVVREADGRRQTLSVQPDRLRPGTVWRIDASTS